MNAEERVWAYLLKNRNATSQDVAMNCDITEVFAEACIKRISSKNWREEYVAPKAVEGVKFDQDKARYDLIPPEIEEAIAKVLTFGAKKYSSNSVLSIVQLVHKLGEVCTCANTISPPSATQSADMLQRDYASLVTQSSIQKQSEPIATPTGSPMSADSAGHVMTQNSSAETLSTLSGSGAIPPNGLSSTETEKGRVTSSTGHRGESSDVLLSSTAPERSQLTDSPSRMRSGYSPHREMSAQYVEYPQADSSTLATTTPQRNSEDFSATDATKAWAYSEILRKALSAHSTTCAVRNLMLTPTPTGVNLFRTGERNWELGMDWGRPYAALRRHMNAWWGGEDSDPETGMSHLWHAACCIAFLTAFEARGVGTDDRPKGSAEAV